MSAVSSCPTDHDLERLLLGQVPACEAAELEQHLAACLRCADKARSLRAEDTLVEAMRAAGSTVEDATLVGPVGELMVRLKDLRPPLLTGADSNGDPTEEDRLDFLAPPEGPGELGRLGGYRILRVLGAGGMGIVLHAEDPQLGRPAALKVLRPALAASASARQRFLREARASAAVRHDNAVTIYQVGEDRGVPFLAMELLEGETLEDRLRREGRLPAVETARIGREAALGLAAAHDHGLIHRDVKPGNLWLQQKEEPGQGPPGSSFGRVKLLDFGLARAGEGEMHLTQTGAIIGTPAYMSPEQARGEPVDARSDLFSLGCVLYRACTGRLPFPGTNASAVLLALTTEQPRPPHADNPEVSPVLSALVLRLLAKDPARRPASAREVADALGALDLGSTPTPRPRRGRRLFAAAVLGLAAVVLAAVFTLRTRQGTLLVEVAEPDVQVLVDGEEKVVIDSKKVGRVELAPGEHRLVVRRGEEELFTQEFSLRSGGEVVLKASWTSKAGEGTTAGPLDRLKAADIRAEDRFEGQPPELVAVLGKPDGEPNCLAFSPDGGRLLLGSWQEQKPVLALWDVAAGKRLWRLDGEERSNFSAVAFAPDGRRFVTVGAHQEPVLREANTGAEVRRFPGAGDCLFAVAFAPDGRTIVTGDRAGHAQPGSVRWWDVSTGEQKANLTGHTYYVSVVAFFPDGRRVASGSHSSDDTVRLWDLPAGKELRHFAGNEATSSLAISPDGRLLASGSPTGVIRVRDLGREGDRPWRELTGHTAPVVAACFSADGKVLASVTADFRILRQDVTSGEKLLERKLAGENANACFAADRRHLAVATARGIFLFRLGPLPARQGS